MKVELLDFKEIENYPSGSGIEFYDGKVYIVGDDARDLLVMDKKWKNPALIHLFNSPEEKITKALKSDLEAMTLMTVEKKPYMLMVGSGSTEERKKGILLNLKTHKKQLIDLTVFYNRIQSAGIKELNIEGVALVYDYIIFANRGNSTHPENHLVITKPDFWKQQDKAPIQILLLVFPQSEKLLGVSGLTYSDKHEDLLLTISTEATPNAIDDGVIGNSYLAVIENLYRKIGREKLKIKVNELIDLKKSDERFKGYKIESVCIQSEKDHSMKLQLVADNDTGKSFLFKIFVEW